MMNGSLVSVIVPVYKVEGYLDECIQSIISQTYTNLEIILVDDGSPDRCPKMCDEWAEKDSRIKVIHKVNGGLSSARNVGLDEASGDYISFVDSDDFFDPKMYEELCDGIKRYDNVGISAIRFLKYVDGKSEIYNKEWVHDTDVIIKSEDFSIKTLLQEVCHAATNKLYSREVIGPVRFREGKLNEDVLFMFDLSKRIEKLDVDLVEIPYDAYYYRIRKGSICQSSIPLFVPVIENLQTIYDEADKENVKLAAYKLRNQMTFTFCNAIIGDMSKEGRKTYRKYYAKFSKLLQEVEYSDIECIVRKYGYSDTKLTLLKKYPSLYRLLSFIKQCLTRSLPNE